jgi:hypothetical protein
MSFKEQLLKIKDNWLLIVLFALCLLVVMFISSFNGNLGSINSIGYKSASQDAAYPGYAGASYSEAYYPRADSNFMPNVPNRIIVKTSSMSVQIKDFTSAENTFRLFIKTNNAIIMSENVNTDYSKYKTGYYTINVPVDNYDALIDQLKNIGEVKSFNENTNDITGSYISLQDTLDAETSRLESYEKLYNSTSNVDEKINLLDRIYDQKRTIKSLESQKENQNERIDYSQISFTLQEKRPTHADLVIASIEDLWSSFKASVNVLLYVLAYVLPFAILGLIIYGIRKLKKH